MHFCQLHSLCGVLNFPSRLRGYRSWFSSLLGHYPSSPSAMRTLISLSDISDSSYYNCIPCDLKPYTLASHLAGYDLVEYELVCALNHLDVYSQKCIFHHLSHKFFVKSDSSRIVTISQSYNRTYVTHELDACRHVKMMV